MRLILRFLGKMYVTSLITNIPKAIKQNNAPKQVETIVSIPPVSDVMVVLITEIELEAKATDTQIIYGSRIPTASITIPRAR